jgi:hypothetical protein
MIRYHVELPRWKAPKDCIGMERNLWAMKGQTNSCTASFPPPAAPIATERNEPVSERIFTGCGPAPLHGVLRNPAYVTYRSRNRWRMVDHVVQGWSDNGFRRDLNQEFVASERERPRGLLVYRGRLSQKRVLPKPTKPQRFFEASSTRVGPN